MNFEQLGIGYGGFAPGVSASGVVHSSSSSNATQSIAQRKKIQGDLIQFLERERGNHTWSHLKEIMGIDLTSNEYARLLDDLKQNNKINLQIDAKTIAYKPPFPNVMNRADIIATINAHSYGVREDQLEDSYHGSRADIDIAVNSGTVYRIQPYVPRTQEGQKTRMDKRNREYVMLYPRRYRDCETQPAMENELKKIWSEVKVPTNAVELESALIESGYMTERQLRAIAAAKSARTAADAKRKRDEKQALKRPRKKFRQKITNVHMLDQLDWLKNHEKIMQAPQSK